jgi:hypothetical protein
MTFTPDPLFELHTGSTLRPADDLISLKQHIPGGQFRYIDIAMQQSRAQALTRWTLLAELASLPLSSTQAPARDCSATTPSDEQGPT